MAAPTPENLSEEFALSPEERSVLVDSLAEHTNSMQAEYYQTKNWTNLQPYMGLIGMMGFVSYPERDGRQINHVRRMIAFDYLSLREPDKKPPKTTAFLREVRKEAKPEIQEVKSFQGDSSQVPAHYKEALSDLNQFQDQLRVDPLLFNLKRTLERIPKG